MLGELFPDKFHVSVGLYHLSAINECRFYLRGHQSRFEEDFFFLSKLCMMAHAYSASSQETEARGWLELAGPTQKSII